MAPPGNQTKTKHTHTNNPSANTTLNYHLCPCALVLGHCAHCASVCRSAVQPCAPGEWRKAARTQTLHQLRSGLSLPHGAPARGLVSYYCGWGRGSVSRRSNENQTRSGHQTTCCNQPWVFFWGLRTVGRKKCSLVCCLFHCVHARTEGETQQGHHPGLMHFILGHRTNKISCHIKHLKCIPNSSIFYCLEFKVSKLSPPTVTCKHFSAGQCDMNTAAATVSIGYTDCLYWHGKVDLVGC